MVVDEVSDMVLPAVVEGVMTTVVRYGCVCVSQKLVHHAVPFRKGGGYLDN